MKTKIFWSRYPFRFSHNMKGCAIISLTFRLESNLFFKDFSENPNKFLIDLLKRCDRGPKGRVSKSYYFSVFSVDCCLIVYIDGALYLKVTFFNEDIFRKSMAYKIL